MVAAASGGAEASTICGKLKDGPEEGCLMKSEITVAVAATPRASATLARKEAAVLLDFTSIASIISLASSPPPEEDSAPEADALAAQESIREKLRELFVFARIIR